MVAPNVSRGKQRYAEESRGMQRKAEVCRDVQRKAEVYRGKQRCAEKYRGKQRYAMHSRLAFRSRYTMPCACICSRPRINSAP